MFGNHETIATIMVVPFLVTRGPSLGCVRGVSASVSVMVHRRFISDPRLTKERLRGMYSLLWLNSFCIQCDKQTFLF